MEIGAHTVTHPILARESDHQAQNEVFDSTKRIKAELNITTLPFAYPDGQKADCQERIEKMVAQAGCYAGVANFAGLNQRTTNRFRLHRFPIGGHHSALRLELDLCGLRAIKTKVSELPARIIRRGTVESVREA